MQSNFKFSRDWTSHHYHKWDKFSPKHILEIGSFEGRSAVYWAQRNTTLSISCIDTWQGSEEHIEIDFNDVERNFDHNISFFSTISKIKMQSYIALSSFVLSGQKFDWIYVDGSHEAPDVLTDAVMSFYILETGGNLVFDDYLWYDSYRFEDWGEQKPTQLTSYPKPAIDNFVNIFYDKLRIVSIGRQLILEKLK